MSSPLRATELWWNARDIAVHGLLVQCPTCRCPLTSLEDATQAQIVCPGCFGRIRREGGIWHALPLGREPHFERFIAEYQAVRAAEGRGSSDAAYYLALPYADLTGRNAAQWKIRGKTYRYFEQRILPALEARHAGGMDVLDLGAGTGWLGYRLALRGHRPVAVDLITNEDDGLGAAVHYQEKLAKLFPRFQAEFDHLPFGDAQFDCAVFNASFHYSQDFAQTLAESLRCLRPGATVIIADTAWYRREESGAKMLEERRECFRTRYGFASDSLPSLEFLTDERLRALETEFGLRFEVHRPSYGLRWRLRPWIARLRRKREPSQFRLYVAEVNKS